MAMWFNARTVWSEREEDLQEGSSNIDYDPWKLFIYMSELTNSRWLLNACRDQEGWKLWEIWSLTLNEAKPKTSSKKVRRLLLGLSTAGVEEVYFWQRGCEKMGGGVNI